MIEFLVIMGAAALIATVGFWLGYDTGAKDTKRRERNIVKAIEYNNRLYTEWKESPEGSEWEKGYAEGIRCTLDTLNSFLERAQ